MRIGDTGGAGLAGRSTRHEANKIQGRLVSVLLLVLLLGQTLLEELVDDKVYHGLTDPPPRGRQSLPEAEDPALRVNPPDHHRQTRVGPVELQPRLHKPDGIRGAGTDKPWTNSTNMIFYSTVRNLFHTCRGG